MAQAKRGRVGRRIGELFGTGERPGAGPPTEPADAAESDPAESALAVALELAAKAGRFDVVAVLARQLDERWRSRVAPGVASLDGARAKR